MFLLNFRSRNRSSWQTYRIINWVILGLMLYLLSLPFLSPLFEKCFPSVWGVCVYRELSGQMCPLCGMTRAVGAVLQRDFHTAVSLNPLSIFAVLFILSEVIFRALLLRLHVSQQSWSLLVRMDILAHMLLVGFFVCYVGKLICKGLFT